VGGDRQHRGENPHFIWRDDQPTQADAGRGEPHQIHGILPAKGQGSARQDFLQLAKIAVITGGNSGIGLATAKVFVKKGARVYITGRRQPELEAAAVLLGPNATPVQGDVSKPADLDRLYGQIRKEVGRVDVVFANAGVVTKAPLGSLTEEQVENQLDVNVKGVIWTVQKALPSSFGIFSSVMSVEPRSFPGRSAFGLAPRLIAFTSAHIAFRRFQTTNLRRLDGCWPRRATR
jgi:NAD(P)-dependent dehydrogenase (short-subunit alcohol dehydrogenase family)